MKKIMTIVLLFVIGGCSTHKKISSAHSSVSSDSSRYANQTLDISRVDSLAAEVRKKVSERSESGTVIIERGGQQPAAPFTITAAFTIDTSAKGDTLRLVSQENEQVNFQVYYDKKTGQAVAQIQGKGGTVNTTPFEKITITNASVTKNTDSSGSVNARSSTKTRAAASDSTLARHQHSTAQESSQIDRSQTGIRNIALAIVGIVLLAGAVLFTLRKKLF